MASAKENAELKNLQERIGTAEISVATLIEKTERIKEIVEAMERLETRIGNLEQRKAQWDGAVTYTDTSNTRICDLENTKSYYRGGIETIAAFIALVISSGVVGAIITSTFFKGGSP